ncbi:MAG: chalcone isomerase family protein [Sulfuritalea sp.]|nr:chalcone isomerase family protein [Sulfuritalea sp.]
MKAVLRPWLLACCLAMIAGRAVAELPPDWRVQGQGEMRWFGFRLYEASLWAPGGNWQADRPYALKLRYSRDISSRQLVEASIDEMQRLGGVDKARLARWKLQLEQVFPDVQEGDVIIGISRPARGAEFYHQDRLTGRIDDVEFARAFFAIWLDEDTREPGLRKLLLGRS